jgi:Cell Wall Hydrolase
LKIDSTGEQRLASPIFRRVRGVIMLALMGLLSSCVMPLAASRGPEGVVSIALDGPVPFDPAADMTALFAADAEAAPPVLAGTPSFAPTLLVPGPAAPSIIFQGQTAQDILRASLCLTSAIYYEAGNEPEEGQRAVAQVVLNRVRHPAYPDTVCGVVYQGTERGDNLCQFTFGCDGAMMRVPDAASWARARRVALAALAGSVYAPVGMATHYHTLAVNPVWNKSLTPTAIVGAHIFFRWPGGAGAPSAFHASYRGGEPLPAPKPKLVTLASAGPSVMAGAITVPAPLPETFGASTPKVAMASSAVSDDSRYLPGALPESDVLPAYASSGQWITR